MILQIEDTPKNCKNIFTIFSRKYICNLGNKNKCHYYIITK